MTCRNERQKKLNPLKTYFNILLISTAVGSFLINPSFAAQEIVEDGDASIVTYDKEFFIQYEPVTLLDMLQRVPGAPEILNANRQQRGGGGGNGGAQNQGERGFGSGGDQILIDGKRLAGKSNNINDTLGRISAENVQKIELIRGAASGLDVQSQGLVINIVLAEGASTSTTFWKLTSETKQGHSPGLEALISHSGSAGRLDYTFSGERTSNNGFFTRDERFYNPSDVFTSDRLVDMAFHQRGWKLNSNLTYNFEDNSVLRLNGLWSTQNQKNNEDRIRTGDVLENILWYRDEDQKAWEVGGDYTRSLGFLGRLKALFVVNHRTEDQLYDRSKNRDTSPFTYTIENVHELKQEKIFRASLTNNITSNQTLEVGGEAAINSFDKRFNSETRDLATDPFEVEAQDNVEISENRYEVFANHTYNISSTIVLQSTLTTEFSKIVADNIFPDNSISRRDTSFTYFKPRVNLRYDLTSQDQLRGTVEKKVSQLDFNNFVTRYDQRAEKYQFGNTNIRPEQLWEFLAAYEHRFNNDGGSIQFEGFYRHYKDKITLVDFTEYLDFAHNAIEREAFFSLPPDMALRDYIVDSGSDFISKSGNVDKATSYGVNVKGSLRLGLVGLPDAVFSGTYTYEKSNVVDPFTLEDRPFQRTSLHRWDLNYRHDMTDIGLSYGGRAVFESDAATNDIYYYWPFSPQASLSVFVEYNILKGIKLRAEAKQLTGKRGYSTQYNYIDHIRFNELDERIDKRTTVPREIEISIQGTF
ncbi:MAG: TonB-dependent receptor [Emcibacteraceae bacterium]